MTQPSVEQSPGAAPRPSIHHDFRPDINGLRALAVLSVLAFHAGLPPQGGFAGVDIFFVISGFLISRIILSERAAGAFSLLDFYGKRVKRILPALLLTLFTTWIAGFILFNPMEFRLLGGHMEGSSYFSVNLWLYRQAAGPAAYFDWKSRLLPLLHLWSLSIEEQFYLCWPALLLLLFRVRRLLTPAIVLIFFASLAYGFVLTGENSTAAFYLLSARAWELALGALLAEREVFWKPAPPSPLAADLRAGAGIALMLFSLFWLIDERSPWPGLLALAPTLGCALVIASPGSRIGSLLLGNRPAQFFGAISYPLYLWHWPLLSFAHHQIGKELPLALAVALLGLSVLLAWLTWRFAERPVADAYRRRPAAVAAALLAGLALAGGLGVATRVTGGFPQRFSAPIREVYAFYLRDGEHMFREMTCTEIASYVRVPLDKARERARAFIAANNCLKPPRADLPSVVVLGDSHALQLISGLRAVFGERANILHLTAIGCRPLLAWTEAQGDHGGPDGSRCQAINEDIARNLLALQPAAIVVAGYYAEYDKDVHKMDAFIKDFDANVVNLRRDGLRSPIFVMGQVPTWKPDLSDMLIAELRAGKPPTEITHENLDPNSAKANALLAAHSWGENVHYLSQFAQFCDARGCRRFVGPRRPDDMAAWDYGHFTSAASLYAAKNVLGPALGPVLDAARTRPSN